MDSISETKSVLVCDTQPVAIEGVRGVLSRAHDLRFAGAVSTLEAALEFTRGLSPSVVVLDKALGTPAITNWLTLLNTFASSTAAVVWGSAINESEALRLVQAGARGVLRRTSDSDTFLNCLRAVTGGNTWMENGIFGNIARPYQAQRTQLTRREQEVAGLVERGLRNRDIGLNLGIQTGTVKIHLKHIFEKTGVRGRYGLALNGLRERGAITFAE
jgi:DNA-binding NarL/FixJ family response regulator